METTTKSLSNITFFPTDIKHPETGEWVRIVGYKRPHEYLSGIFAYSDPETGEYLGMMSAQDGMKDDAPEVEIRDQ